MKKYLLPFSLTALCALMSACGGESNKMSENPLVKPDGKGELGCTFAESAQCFEFTMEYPIAGIQYTCTSDNINTFATTRVGNIVTGGCNKTDTVTFFLNAADNKRIELGSVHLPDLGYRSASVAPVHLGMIDLAQGLLNQEAKEFNLSDPVVKVAVNLVKLFQALGVSNANSHVLGDVQLVELSESSLKDIDKIEASVDDAAYINGKFVDFLKPWVDVSTVSDEVAFKVLKDVNNVSLGALYQASLPIPLLQLQGLVGTAKQGQSVKTLLGTFFVLSDRSGYALGYGVQWRGVPDNSSETNAGALGLMTQSNPIMMYGAAQEDWINPITKRLASGEKYRFITSENDTFFINQGRLINDYGVAGSETFYSALTGQSTIIQQDLAKWTQTSGSDQYTGTVDFLKSYPIAYLDRRVFKSVKNAEVGQKYIFPLYATLTFNFDGTGVAPVDLGIVIDENGDIRTDIRANATANDMSGQCGVVADPSVREPKDHYGVQQYRIGTVAAANYQPNQQDLAISPRIILAGSQFGHLDGLVAGVNLQIADDGDAPTINNSNGVKINLYNLITSINNGSNNLGALGISSLDNSVAKWGNVYNQSKSIYIQANKDKYTPTAAEEEMVKRASGTISIKLADCFEVKTKQ